MATPEGALNTATTRALEDTYITANCSFVTSTESLFKFGASDVLGVLKNLGIKDLDGFNKLIDQENPQTEINGLFKQSIEQIVNNIDKNGYSVVGLQEVNSNGFTNDTIDQALQKISPDDPYDPKLNETVKNHILVLNALKRKPYFHILGGVKTKTTNLYTSLGYILPGKVSDYLTVENGIAEKDEKVDNHAEYNAGFSKNIMAICDLGEENEVSIDGKTILLYKNDKKNHDDGRPISMVVRQRRNSSNNSTPKEGDTEVSSPPEHIYTNYASHIYINCHMLNPSVLKIFDTDKNKLSEESLLQIGKKTVYNNLTGMDIWYKYCQDRFSKCINELVYKFRGLKIDDNTKIIFFGDFNDSLGYLASKPLTFTINGKEYYVQIFGNNEKTCCPNTNSAYYKGGRTIDSIIQQKPFGITFSNTKKENTDKIKDELPTHLKNYNNFNNLAFPGDYIGVAVKKKGVNISHESKVSIIEEGGSDHKFLKVVFSATPAKGGKRRRTRRKNKNKNAKKTNKKGKSKKYRKKGRKTRKIRRRK